MCGNYGVLAPTGEVLNTADIAIFRGLMVANQARGDDATGLALLDSEGHLALHKDAVCAQEFCIQKKVRDILKKPGHILLGHTRAASTGDVTPRNAHPFLVEGAQTVVGTHNGVLSNWLTFKTKFPEMEVDSEAIFHLLSEGTAPKDVFGLLYGSATCAWANLTTDKVFLSRERNPLFVLCDRKRKRVYYSSLEWPLIQAAAMLAPREDMLMGAESLTDRTVYTVSPLDPVAEWEAERIAPAIVPYTPYAGRPEWLDTYMSGFPGWTRYQRGGYLPSGAYTVPPQKVVVDVAPETAAETAPLPSELSGLLDGAEKMRLASQPTWHPRKIRRKRAARFTASAPAASAQPKSDLPLKPWHNRARRTLYIECVGCGHQSSECVCYQEEKQEGKDARRPHFKMFCRDCTQVLSVLVLAKDCPCVVADYSGATRADVLSGVREGRVPFRDEHDRLIYIGKGEGGQGAVQ